MKRKPPVNDNDSPQDTVQNYLDLMLSPASDMASQQVSHLPERVKNPAINKVPSPLTMVAGTSLSSGAVHQRKRHSEAATSSAKPFADPVKPLTLKMPLSTVKSERVLEQKNIEEERLSPNVKPPVKVSDKTSSKKTTPIETEPEPVAQKAIVPPVGLTRKEYEKASAWLENGRPRWAQSRFECLLFTVGGLTLAVPLVELGSIYRLDSDAELTSIFGQADWFLGLLNIKGFNIRTVNTSKVVMPERYNPSMQDNFTYVITINNVDWGLAVDSVSNAIVLEPDEIRWRSERSKRPWLAGTLVDRMCALLDASQLALMFMDEDRKKRKPE